MNKDLYAAKMQIVSKQAGSIAFRATYGKFNRDANLLAVDSLRILLTEAELLLLDKHTGAITEADHFANTNVGRSLPPEGNPNSSESSQEASRETGDVRQNLEKPKPEE
jgi:hypothetical protein